MNYFISFYCDLKKKVKSQTIVKMAVDTGEQNSENSNEVKVSAKLIRFFLQTDSIKH